MPSPPSGYRLPDKKRGNNQEGVHLNPVSTGSGVIPPEMVFRCYIGPLQPCVLYTVKEMQFPYVQSPSQKEVTGILLFYILKRIREKMPLPLPDYHRYYIIKI